MDTKFLISISTSLLVFAAVTAQNQESSDSLARTLREIIVEAN